MSYSGIPVTIASLALRDREVNCDESSINTSFTKYIIFVPPIYTILEDAYRI